MSCHCVRYHVLFTSVRCRHQPTGIEVELEHCLLSVEVQCSPSRFVCLQEPLQLSLEPTNTLTKSIHIDANGHGAIVTNDAERTRSRGVCREAALLSESTSKRVSRTPRRLARGARSTRPA